MALISVFIPVCNEPRLPWAVGSILAQDFADLELVIADNGKRPDPYIEAIAGAPRVSVLKVPHGNVGPTQAVNMAIQVARGQYVARQDADDVSSVSRLRKQLDFLIRNHLDVCSCQYDYLPDSPTHPARSCLPTNQAGIMDGLKIGNCLGGGYWMARRDVLLELGGQTWNYPGCADWEFWVRLVQAGYAIGLVDEILYHIWWRRKARIEKEQLWDSMARLANDYWGITDYSYAF